LNPNPKGNNKLNILILLLCTIASSFAAGKPQPKPDPAFPTPYRIVTLTQVGTKTFDLPGGSPVNFTADFQTILSTSTTLSDAFQPSEGWPTPCNEHLEIRSSVTSFQLNVVKAGISFGYSPIGGIVGAPKLKGKFEVSVGEISFDASIWQCKDKACVAIAAATSDQSTVGIDLSFEVDFDQINAGASLLTNPALGTITRKLMVNSLYLLGKDPNVMNLPWQAMIKNTDANLGLVIFDAGTALNIKKDQLFEIYELNNNTPDGACDLFKVIAHIHTTQVNTLSSIALVDQLFNNGVIKIGDVVMGRSTKMRSFH
jgi:hypothetical protein